MKINVFRLLIGGLKGAYKSLRDEGDSRTSAALKGGLMAVKSAREFRKLRRAARARERLKG